MLEQIFLDILKSLLKGIKQPALEFVHFGRNELGSYRLALAIRACTRIGILILTGTVLLNIVAPAEFPTTTIIMVVVVVTYVALESVVYIVKSSAAGLASHHLEITQKEYSLIVAEPPQGYVITSGVTDITIGQGEVKVERKDPSSQTRTK